MGTGNQPHQIIVVLNLPAFKFDGILNVNFFEIQSNHERMFSVRKIEPNAKAMG